MRLSDEYIAEAIQRARRYQGAWTGTTGTIAADSYRLAQECLRLRAVVAELRGEFDEHGYYKSEVQE